MLKGVVVAFALPSLAAAAIPRPPVWPVSACTDKSLSIPSWIISRFKATGSDASFHILNRASNYEGTITCTQGKCTAAGNTAIHVTTQVSGGNAQVNIDDIWSCSDKRDSITVHATGSSTIALTSEGTPVFPETLIRGSIKSPVTLTPAYPDPPTGYDLASCSAKMTAPSWTVTNTELRNITELYIDPQTFRYVFPGLYFYTTITNDATGFSTNCSFELTTYPEENPGAVTSQCTPDVYNRIGTTVTFNQQTGKLSLDQTWYCIENSATNQMPSAVSAAGTATVPLSCAVDPAITDAPVIRCTNARTTVPGSVTERVADLPVFSLTDPPPTTGGCTVDTLTNASWTLSHFSFDADNTTEPWHIRELGMLVYLDNGRIGLWTDARNVWYPMINTTNNNHTWVEAVTYYNVDVQSQYRPFFVYDYGDSGRLDLRQAWECNDKDPAHPLLFNATGITHIPRPSCRPWTPEVVTCSAGGQISFLPSNWTYTVLNV